MARSSITRDKQAPADQNALSEDEARLDRQPGSNRGSKGQMGQSRKVAATEEGGVEPVLRQDDLEGEDRARH
jgi:hypothetical protein